MLTKEQTDVLIPDTFQQTSIDKYQGSLHLSGALANKHLSRQQNSANLDMTVTDPGGVVDDMQLLDWGSIRSSPRDGLSTPYR